MTIKMRCGVLLVALALLGGACGDDDGGAGSTTTSTTEKTSSSTAPSTTAEDAIPGPPDGVYENFVTEEDWVAAGNPADTFADVNEEGHYVLTLEAGSVHVDCVLSDGTSETCFDGTYTTLTPDTMVVGDDLGQKEVGWSFADEELTLTIDPVEDAPIEKAIFTSHPWEKIG
jgi:hypothetical protein